MAYAPNKIRINSGSAQGMDGAIESELDNALFLGEEITDMGLAPKTADLRDEMARACKEHFDAEMKYYLFLREFNEKLMAFIDTNTP